MDARLFERLLHQQESATLDFKSQQYAFVNGTPEQKGELLKDILAFANAWRETDAHILIGVQEVSSGRAVVCGIPPAAHLHDHSVQQFVASKLNRVLSFSYSSFKAEGVDVGVIKIPVQDRPFYPNVDYGRLRKYAVYVRQGSSTAEASPDDIFRMGKSTHRPPSPALTLALADLKTRQQLGHKMVLEPLLIEIPSEESIPNYSGGKRYRSGALSYNVHLLANNIDYYRRVAIFLDQRHRQCPVGVAVSNSANAVAEAVVVTIKSAQPIILEPDLPHYPARQHPDFAPRLRRIASEPTVGCYASVYELRVPIGNIQPGITEFSSEPFYVTSTVAETVTMEVTISADNLSKPISLTIAVEFQPRTGTLSLQRLLEEADQTG